MKKDERANSEELFSEIKEMLKDVLNTFENKESTLGEKLVALNVLRMAIELHSIA